MGRHSVRSKGISVGAAAACASALFLGAVVGHDATAIAAVPASAQTLIDAGVVVDGTNPSYTGLDRFPSLSPDTVVVWTDGTGGGHNPGVAGPVAGNRTTLLVVYPQSKWPTSAGNTTSALTAPTWNESRDIGAMVVLTSLETLLADPPKKPIVLSGFSQGADVTLAGLELAVAQGLEIDEDVIVYVIADPRNPWGEWQGRAKEPFGKLRAAFLDTPDSARNPADTGSVPVTSVIVTGDTIANRQWVWYRPISSAIVNALGGIVHGNPDTYGNLDQYGTPREYKSVDGNHTYLVHQSPHSATLVAKQVAGYLGVSLTDVQLDRFDRLANAWYPMQVPTAANAAVPVYEVTVPAAVATGVEPSSATTPVFSSTSSVEEPEGASSAESEPDNTSSENESAVLPESAPEEDDSPESPVVEPQADDESISEDDLDSTVDSADAPTASESSSEESPTPGESDDSDSSDSSSDE